MSLLRLHMATLRVVENLIMDQYSIAKRTRIMDQIEPIIQEG